MRSGWQPRLLHAVLAAALLATGALRGSVLCVGAGGHFAIEAIAAACCRPAATSDASTASLDDGCAFDCTDTVLRLPAVTDERSFSGRHPARALPGVLVAAPGHHHGRPDTPRAVAASAAPPGPVPRQARTTVNLC